MNEQHDFENANERGSIPTKGAAVQTPSPCTNDLFPMMHASHELDMSFGSNCRDICPKQRRIKWSDLVQEFATPDLKRGTLPLAAYMALNKLDPKDKKLRNKEKDGTYAMAAAFTKPNTRDASDVMTLCGFFGDIDTGNLAKEDIAQRLDGFVHLIFSSYSYHPNDRRWRFFVPYQHVITPAQHQKVYQLFQTNFNHQLDTRCETTNQLWYTPACPPDAGDKYVFAVGDGDLFDPSSVPDSVPTQQPSQLATAGPNQRAIENVQMPAITAAEQQRLFAALGLISADDRDIWIKVALALKHRMGDAGQTMWTAWSKTSTKFDEDDAVATWDSLIPRTEDGVTLGTIFHLAKQNGYNNNLVAPVQPAASGPLLPLFDLKDAMVTHYLQHPAPPRRWLLKNTLPLGKVGMIVAPGGTGKSFLMIQMAVAVATQTLLADHWEVDTPGASLILCAEEDNDDLHHRLRDVLDATVPHTPATEQLIIQRVFIKSMLTENNLMTHADANRQIVQTDYVDRLVLAAHQIPDLKLIIIDPASRFRGGDENAAQDTTRFVEALERLRAATGATVLLVHHTNKGSMNADEANQGASRGSSALTDGVRWQMSLNKPSKQQAKDNHLPEFCRHEYVLATITKNNGAPPQAPVLLQRGPTGVLAATRPSTPQPSPARLLVNLIQSEAALSHTYTANSLEQKYGGTGQALKLSAQALRKLIADCIRSKYLHKRTLKPMGVLELTGNMPP